MKSGDRFSFFNSDNPYHTRPADSSFRPEEAGALDSIKEGFSYEVDDMVRLELTAEQMLGEEVDLAKAYISEDTHGLWQDVKLGFAELELITGDWLLRAADPTRVDWHEHHWWGDEGSQLRH